MFIFKLFSKGDQSKIKLANLKFSEIGDGRLFFVFGGRLVLGEGRNYFVIPASTDLYAETLCFPCRDPCTTKHGVFEKMKTCWLIFSLWWGEGTLPQRSFVLHERTNPVSSLRQTLVQNFKFRQRAFVERYWSCRFPQRRPSCIETQ